MAVHFRVFHSQVIEAGLVERAALSSRLLEII